MHITQYGGEIFGCTHQKSKITPLEKRRRVDYNNIYEAFSSIVRSFPKENSCSQKGANEIETV